MATQLKTPTLLERARDAAGWIAANPPAEDRVPADALARLFATGAGSAFTTLDTPADVHTLRDTLRAVGGADLATGRIFEGHVNATQLVHAYGSPDQRAALRDDLVNDRLFGVWNTDAPEPVRLEGGPGAWVLRGAKSFSTGAGHVERMLITAAHPDGGRQMVLAHHADDARVDQSGWIVRGMGASQSGVYDFDGLAVPDEWLIGAPDDYVREPRFSAGAWRFTAVQLGGAEALVRLYRDHLVETGKGDDPIQRLRFGQAAAALRSAGLWVAQAADAAEAGTANAIPLVAMTRGLVEDAAMGLMEAVTRAVGTRSFVTGTRIDRIVRDLGLYLRQPVPDQARDRAAAAWLEADGWGEDEWW